MLEKSDSVPVQLPWVRHQWRKVTAWIEDHPLPTLLAGGGLLAAVVFYGTRLNGYNHAAESLVRWKLDNFGGVQRVERSIEVAGVVLSFARQSYDRLDAMTLTTAHLGATAFRQEFREISGRPNGLVRVLTLDPRLADADHPHHGAFVKYGEAEQLEPWEFSARVWHCCAVLLHLKRELGPRVEVRLVSAPAPDATPPYFSIGRSVHVWRSADPNRRLDVLVPEPHKPVAADSFTAPALIIKDRPDHQEARRFEKAFAAMWETAVPIDSALQSELLRHLDAPRVK